MAVLSPQLFDGFADNQIMNAEQIHDDLRIRDRTAELCTLMGINPLTHRDQCEALMETMLDVAIEGWLSAKALGR